MLEHYKGDEDFVRKILDYVNQADKGKMILTKFFDPHQQSIVSRVIGNRLSVHSFGGFINAENKRMLICHDYYEIVPDDFHISVLKADYNDSFGKLKHSDVLGALMNLGIKREVIGDICESPLSFAICDKNCDYIKTHLRKIKKSSVHFGEVNELIEIRNEFKNQIFYVSSLRLDKLISSLFRISRTKANEAINSGNVKKNYQIISNASDVCKDADILSLRHYGRVKIHVTDKVTRSGNILIEGKFYK